MFDPKKGDNSTMECPSGYVHKGEQGPTIVTEVIFISISSIIVKSLVHNTKSLLQKWYSIR